MPNPSGFFRYIHFFIGELILLSIAVHGAIKILGWLWKDLR